MADTTFHYDSRRVNHRIVTSVMASMVVLLIAILVPDAPVLFHAVLAVAFVAVLFQIVRFKRLQGLEVSALTLSDEGLNVTAWGLGVVPWSEIEGARRAARNNIEVTLKRPQEWRKRMTPLKRMLAALEAVFGTGSFTIDGGLLKGGPGPALKEIQERLDQRE